MNYLCTFFVTKLWCRNSTSTGENLAAAWPSIRNLQNCKPRAGDGLLAGTSLRNR
jgi:hypothetical protein